MRRKRQQYFAIWPDLAYTIQRLHRDENADRWKARFRNVCNETVGTRTDRRVFLLNVLAPILAFYPGLASLVVASSAMNPSDDTIWAILPFLPMIAFVYRNVLTRSLSVAIHSFLFFLLYVALITLGFTALFVNLPDNSTVDPEATKRAAAVVQGLTAIGIQFAIATFATSITLLSLFAIRIALVLLTRPSVAEAGILRALVVLIHKIRSDQEFAHAVRSKARYIGRLQAIADGLRNNIVSDMQLGRNPPAEISRRLSDAADCVEDLVTWIALPQTNTRHNIEKPLLQLLAALTTGRLHYLPAASRTSSTTSDLENVYPGVRKFMIQVISLAPAVALVALSLSGWLIPNELQNWATGFGTLWLLVGFASIFTGATGTVIGSVKDILSAANSNQGKQ